MWALLRPGFALALLGDPEQSICPIPDIMLSTLAKDPALGLVSGHVAMKRCPLLEEHQCHCHVTQAVERGDRYSGASLKGHSMQPQGT